MALWGSTPCLPCCWSLWLKTLEVCQDFMHLCPSCCACHGIWNPCVPSDILWNDLKPQESRVWQGGTWGLEALLFFLFLLASPLTVPWVAIDSRWFSLQTSQRLCFWWCLLSVFQPLFWGLKNFTSPVPDPVYARVCNYSPVEGSLTAFIPEPTI